MPIAAKLSRRLHETLGAEAAEAMVDWMQRVETQRSELAELNELNFARIEARFAVAEAAADAHFVELQSTLRQEFHSEFSQLRQDFAHLEARIERRFGDLMKWSFVFWIGSTVTLVLALASLSRFGR